jgi:transcriptional regulator with XRE-family HTH domain
MTADEFRATLKALGLRQRILAEALGVEPNTVSRWAKGKVTVPRYAELCLILLAAISERRMRDILAMPAFRHVADTGNAGKAATV